MIIDISDSTFKKILNDEKLFLPLKWDGVDFSVTLNTLYNHYINRLETLEKEATYESIEVDINNIKSVCGLIRSAVKHYLNGFPSNAYNTFTLAMSILMDNRLRVYQNNNSEYIDNVDDTLDFYRVICVNENVPYKRSRVFHTPYTLRSKVATNRYSIAGYPSLYLATNLALCCEEIHYNPHSDLALAARYKLETNVEYTNTRVRVIELAVKPQDFLQIQNNNEFHRRRFENLLENAKTKSAYLLWYPLIAACSYIRPNKNNPFAAEYIIPQLLMQWVRMEIAMPRRDYDELIGLRYFSCASIKASDMGFNYVFPVSGTQKSASYPYCPILMKAFKLTKPHYLSEYHTLRDCEWNLERDRNINFIDC